VSRHAAAPQLALPDVRTLPLDFATFRRKEKWRVHSAGGLGK
jgi:hypothetical protein